jgi:hypothetical protein
MPIKTGMKRSDRSWQSLNPGAQRFQEFNLSRATFTAGNRSEAEAT